MDLAFLFLIPLFIAGLVSFVCFIYNIVVAFQQGDTLAGILSICGIIGFVLGWVNVEKWGHKPVMIVWTIALLVSIVFQVLATVMAAGAGQI